MNEQQQDWIDRFLRDEMTAEERKTFESQLKEDAGLKEQLDFTKMVRTAISSRNEKLSLIRKWDEETVPEKKGNGYRTPILRTIGIAGLVAAAVIGFFLFSPLCLFRELPIVNMVNIEHYECYKGKKTISRIAELVHEKNYKEALSLIEKEEHIASHGHSHPDGPDMPYIMAAPRNMSTNRNMSANRRDTEELQWLKAHALAGLGRMKEALECLDRIRQAEGIYKDKADSLFRCWKSFQNLPDKP
ncbi:MAG: hypothetical protein K2N13_08520 [Paraprevotella sp.]|nr:hypothetical protein [Paraprevotella sp.]